MKIIVKYEGLKLKKRSDKMRKILNIALALVVVASLNTALYNHAHSEVDNDEYLDRIPQEPVSILDDKRDLPRGLPVHENKFDQPGLPVEEYFDRAGNGHNAGEIPEKPFLLRNYPNPFNASTTISFDLTVGSDVKLEVYNIKGQKVAELVDDFMPSGNHQLLWNAEDNSSGVYFYKLKAGRQSVTKSMTLMK
ncbi:MAG: T9SS type A sorting domain-containing protein [candidate division Zixibacteria bacterium]|nr:T9SS type A sorting domain-containing protein [candidate division Zixibacteria bacterium]